MKPIQALVDLINRETTDENSSQYFIVVQRWLYCLMIGYYLFFTVICVGWGFYRGAGWTIVWIIMTAMGFYFTYHHSGHLSLMVFLALMTTWVILSIYNFGWSVGGQHFLLPMLVMVFFYVNYGYSEKIFWMLSILALRIGLFIYCQGHEPLYVLGYVPSVIMQILNSLTLFSTMTVACINFSSNIQASEKQLLNVNKRLRMQANTDQLTGLANRRSMIDQMNEWIEKNPMSQFCVAMADIDFFKKVNDTWGHECGDETLKALASLFQSQMEDKGMVCRWGGEEFFFFFKDVNLDEARYICELLNAKIRKLVIPYQDQNISVTMTFGVEEGDYDSWDLTEIVKRADDKLYIGTEKGRDRVVA